MGFFINARVRFILPYRMVKLRQSLRSTFVCGLATEGCASLPTPRAAIAAKKIGKLVDLKEVICVGSKFLGKIVVGAEAVHKVTRLWLSPFFLPSLSTVALVDLVRDRSRYFCSGGEASLTHQQP